MIISFRSKWLRCVIVVVLMTFFVTGIQNGYQTTETVFLNWFHKDSNPDQQKEIFEPSQYVLAEFSTPIENRGPGRIFNQKKVMSIFKDKVIEPDSTFSVLDAIGSMTAEEGWQMGEKSLVMGSKLVDGMAGGICQPVTTLYNAALLSDFEILKRFNHAIALTYVDPGRDAAIYRAGGQDLVIKNTHEFPVTIKGEMTKDQIIIRLVTQDSRAGEWKKQHEINFEVYKTGEIPYRQVVRKDTSLAVGEKKVIHEGIKGYKNVKLFRIVKKDGEVKRRELISQNSYLPFPEEIVKGTKKAE